MVAQSAIKVIDQKFGRHTSYLLRLSLTYSASLASVARSVYSLHLPS